MVIDLSTNYGTADTDSVLDMELETFVESYLEWKKGRK
jgi:hypothetical protein